jgi:hypothetical protein
MGGFKMAIDMGKLKIKHKEMHGEDMNLKLYREMFNRPTNLDNVEYQKDRFSVEVSIQRNAAGNGLVYRLKQPLDCKLVFRIVKELKVTSILW